MRVGLPFRDNETYLWRQKCTMRNLNQPASLSSSLFKHCLSLLHDFPLLIKPTIRKWVSLDLLDLTKAGVSHTSYISVVELCLYGLNMTIRVLSQRSSAFMHEAFLWSCLLTSLRRTWGDWGSWGHRANRDHIGYGGWQAFMASSGLFLEFFSKSKGSWGAGLAQFHNVSVVWLFMSCPCFRWDILVMELLISGSGDCQRFRSL